MTLKQALNVICESKYCITIHDETGTVLHDGELTYKNVKVDYLHDDNCYEGSFSKAVEKRSEVYKAKHRVKWITYNKSIDMIEVSVDILA